MQSGKTATKALVALAAMGLAAQPIAAHADQSAPTPVAAPVATPAAKPSGPSAFVRCDGAPNKPSTLGTVARLVAITAVIGLLIPERESADPKKRASGQDGIKACDEALTGPDPAKDGGRRIELIFGRAIHRMELKDWDGALADIRAVSANQPDLTKTAAYHQSLGLTATELEAMALTGKGDFPGAHAAGLRLAANAPYDIGAMLKAEQFAVLARADGPGEQAYYDQLVKMFPSALKSRADHRAAAGKFREAASDIATFAAIVDSIPKGLGYYLQSVAAIGYRLAGDTAEADRLIKIAMERAAKDTAQGKNDTLVANTNECNDLYAILVALESGQALRARTLFSARSHWKAVFAGMVAEVSRRLQTVGSPADQANTPILSPAQILAADEALAAARINDPGDDNADRFNTFRTAISPTEFNKFAANVWRTDKSKYITPAKDAESAGDLVDVSRSGAGVPAGYAMLLHLALVARARGEAGFMMIPVQRRTWLAQFRMGKPGDGRLFAEATFDPAKVIADLAPIIPEPVKK